MRKETWNPQQQMDTRTHPRLPASTRESPTAETALVTRAVASRSTPLPRRLVTATTPRVRSMESAASTRMRCNMSSLHTWKK